MGDWLMYEESREDYLFVPYVIIHGMRNCIHMYV